MRILLIYPKSDLFPFYLQAPMGILYLAASLRERHEVRLYDANIDLRSLDNAVSKFDPEAIGVSYTISCIRTASQIAKRFGGNGRLMMAGGSQPTYQPKECLDSGFDLVARGEVDDTLSDFLETLDLNSSFIKPAQSVPPGYYFKDEQGNYVDTGIATCCDVNRFFPARDLLPRYYHDRYTHGVLMGSRGCHFRCVFCASARSTYRKRHPRDVVDELDYVVNTEGHKSVHFIDDIFTHDPKWVRKVCEGIEKCGIRFEWSVNSRSHIPRENWEVFDLIYRAGCKFIMFGIEAAEQKVLNQAHKGSTVVKMFPAIQRAREAGLSLRCNLMAGLPRSTYDDHLRNIDFMEMLLPDQVIVSLCTPYPGSKLYENPERYGIRLKVPEWMFVFQRDYVLPDTFGDAIEYQNISSQEILQFIKALQYRLGLYGYVSVTDARNRGYRIVKTFLDKPKLLPIREQNHEKNMVSFGTAEKKRI